MTGLEQNNRSSSASSLSHLMEGWKGATSHAPVERRLSDSLYLISGEWPRLPFTARIERAHSYRARSASKKGTWPLPSILTAPTHVIPLLKQTPHHRIGEPKTGAC